VAEKNPSLIEQVRFRCPHCPCVLFVNVDQAGQVVRCPGCRERIQVPYQLSSVAGSTTRRTVASATRRATATPPAPPRTVSSTLARIVAVVLAVCLLSGLVAIPILVGVSLPVLKAARQRVAQMEAHNRALAQRQQQSALPAAPALGAPEIAATALGKAVVVDDVRILPLRARIGLLTRDFNPPAESSDSATEYLVLELTLENTTPGRDIILRDTWLQARLADNSGRVQPPLFPRNIMSDEIIGRTGYGVLRPGAVINDIIVFELPSPQATKFRLEADPGFWRVRQDGLAQELSASAFAVTFGAREIRQAAAPADN
jgi:hypothetical protein